MKEDFFSKFKDYNKELEKILEYKDFSQDTKNLLLSVFYKLETSYADYFLVKRKCKTKQEYLENILESIKLTNGIRLVTPNDNDFNKLKEYGLYKIDFKLKIIVVLENEFAMLSALLGLNEFQIHVKEQYNLVKNSMSYLLNTAYDMEKIEVIRDFNAWSWNTAVDEIKDININLIYQNLKLALNNNIFEKVEHLDIDIINHIKQILLTKYNKDTVEVFLYLIFKTSILQIVVFFKSCLVKKSTISSSISYRTVFLATFVISFVKLSTIFLLTLILLKYFEDNSSIFILITHH